jgi:hypothetical protein
MGTINIQIAVDGNTLAQQIADKSINPGTQSSPTNLGSYSSSDVYISMTTQSGNVNNNTQGQSELNVKANSGDTIEWAITTFDNNIDYTVYLYNGSFSPSTAMSALNYISPQINNYYPPSGNPTATPIKYKNQAMFAQGTVIQTGLTIQYTLSFMLVNNATGTIIGYFMWDPFITVN